MSKRPAGASPAGPQPHALSSGAAAAAGHPSTAAASGGGALLSSAEQQSLHAVIVEYLHSISLHDSALALQREWLARQQVLAAAEATAASGGSNGPAPPAAAVVPRVLSAKDRERADAMCAEVLQKFDAGDAGPLLSVLNRHFVPISLNTAAAAAAAAVTADTKHTASPKQFAFASAAPTTVSDSDRERELARRQLVFQCHVYCAIYPLLPASKAKYGGDTNAAAAAARAAMGVFREMLAASTAASPSPQHGPTGAAAVANGASSPPPATGAGGSAVVIGSSIPSKSAALSLSAQHMVYYGLPYVPAPEQHPTFAHLFAPDWVSGLRASLQAFCAQYLTAVSPVFLAAASSSASHASTSTSTSTSSSAAAPQLHHMYRHYLAIGSPSTGPTAAPATATAAAAAAAARSVASPPAGSGGARAGSSSITTPPQRSHSSAAASRGSPGKPGGRAVSVLDGKVKSDSKVRSGRGSVGSGSSGGSVDLSAPTAASSLRKKEIAAQHERQLKANAPHRARVEQNKAVRRAKAANLARPPTILERSVEEPGKTTDAATPAPGSGLVIRVHNSDGGSSTSSGGGGSSGHKKHQYPASAGAVLGTEPSAEQDSARHIVDGSGSGDYRFRLEREHRKTLESVNDLLFLCTLDMWQWMVSGPAAVAAQAISRVQATAMDAGSSTTGAAAAAGASASGMCVNAQTDAFVQQTRNRLILASEHLTHARTALLRHKHAMATLDAPATGASGPSGRISPGFFDPPNKKGGGTYIDYYASLFAVLNGPAPHTTAAPAPQPVAHVDRSPQHAHQPPQQPQPQQHQTLATRKNMVVPPLSTPAEPSSPPQILQTFITQPDSGGTTGRSITHPWSGAVGSARPLHVPPSLPFTAPPALDTAKVRAALRSLDALHKALVLQALRWRLNRPTATTTGAGAAAGAKALHPAFRHHYRQHVLHQYVDGDVLGCTAAHKAAALSGADVKTASPNPGAGLEMAFLLDVLFAPPTLTATSGSAPTTGPTAVALLQEATARFVNALASHSLARTYLLSHPRVLLALIRVLTTSTTDSPLRQHALGALQKCSLRRAPQSAMIRAGVIEWVVDSLLAPPPPPTAAHPAPPPLSDYTREYGAALLMNLCLRSSGKARCGTPTVLPKLFASLTSLLDAPSPQVRTYVNGTLYSVLSRRSVRAWARSPAYASAMAGVLPPLPAGAGQGLADRLTVLLQTAEEPFRRQIEHILLQLNQPTTQQPSSGSPAQDADASDDETGDVTAASEAAAEQADEDARMAEAEANVSSAGAGPGAAAAATEVDEEDEEEDELTRVALGGPTEVGADPALSAALAPLPRGEQLLCSAYLAEPSHAELANTRATQALSARLTRVPSGPTGAGGLSGPVAHYTGSSSGSGSGASASGSGQSSAATSAAQVIAMGQTPPPPVSSLLRPTTPGSRVLITQSMLPPSNYPTHPPGVGGGAGGFALDSAAGVAVGNSGVSTPSLTKRTSDDHNPFVAKRAFPRTPHGSAQRQPSLPFSGNSNLLMTPPPAAAGGGLGIGGSFPFFQPQSNPISGPSSPSMGGHARLSGGRPPLAPSQSQQAKDTAHAAANAAAAATAAAAAGVESLQSIEQRNLPPPPPHVVGAEAIAQYYAAFASRAKVGRTPVTSSPFATSGEFR